MTLERHIQPSDLTAAFGGRYSVSALLGRGGMATVWLADDARHARPVAIKLLRSEFVRPFGAQRFIREIGIAARLNHPHILPVLDSGLVTLDGVEIPYFTMPWVQGRSLAAILQDSRRLPIPDAVRYAAEAADALEYAHGMGIIHRDIKPGNILIQAGHALVADFGIASAQQGPGVADTLTSTGEVLGTPLYMSPEQASGEVVDGRSDVYSLGCVLYEMLAGAPPIVAHNRQALVVARLTERPPPLEARRPGLDPVLAGTVERALATDPARRYQSAAAFRDALQSPKAAPSRQVAYWPAVGLAALALVSVALFLVRARPTSPARPQPVVVLLGGFRDASGTLRAEAAALNDTLRRELQAVPALRVIDVVDQIDVPLDTVRRRGQADWVVRGTLDRLGDSVGATVRLLEVATGAEVRSATRRDATPEALLRNVVSLGPASLFGTVRFGLDSILRDRAELALGADSASLALRERARQAAARDAAAFHTLGPRRTLEELQFADSLLRSGQGRHGATLLDYERARLAVRRGFILLAARQYFPDSAWIEDPEGAFRAAVPLASRVVRAAPQSPDALFLRADAYNWLYELSGAEAWRDSALADLQRASALAGSRSGIWEQRAMLELQEGRYREALYSTQQGLEVDRLQTHAEELIYRQAVALGRLGEYARALEVCRQGAAAFPGRHYYITCEPEVLARTSREPRDAARMTRLADSLVRHGTGALPPFTPMELRLYAAAVLARAGRPDAATRLYHAVTSQWGTPPAELLLDAVYVRQELGDLDSAVALTARVARDAPASIGSLETLPWYAATRRHAGYGVAIRGVSPVEVHR